MVPNRLPWVQMLSAQRDKYLLGHRGQGVGGEIEVAVGAQLVQQGVPDRPSDKVKASTGVGEQSSQLVRNVKDGPQPFRYHSSEPRDLRDLREVYKEGSNPAVCRATRKSCGLVAA